MDKVKEFIEQYEKIIIIVGVLLIVSAISYDVFRKPDSAGGIAEVRSNLSDARQQQQTAGTAIAESQRITSTIRQTNTNIQQSNNAIRSTISESQQLNKSSEQLIIEGRNIIKGVRERGQ